MDYSRVAIGDGDFLLPESSELTMRETGGLENRNRVRFASCREFRGQSVLKFTDTAAIKDVAAPERVELPRDVGIALSLAAGIDTRSAAVGDPVTANLETDIRQKGQVLFLKGSTARGRITRLEQREGATVVGLEFFALEGDAVRAALKLRLEEVAGSEFLDPQPRRPVGAARPGEGVIALGEGRFRLNRGILMFWRTNP
jgi:hypothetical protein